jgi:2-methylisocitrate lyase-like PEP mutase family enzyme
VALYLNARTDVYLRGLVPPEQRVAETLARAARYRAAGADGLFVPGLTDETSVRAIATEAGLPLNLLARSALPAADELQRWGVRRLSAGSDIAQSMYARMGALASGFLRDGDCKPLAAEAMSYSQVNALFQDR